MYALIAVQFSKGVKYVIKRYLEINEEMVYAK